MLFVYFLALYAAIGLVFSVAFFFVGYRVINPEAAHSTKRVRVLWCPAAVAIWPLLVGKWVKNRGL